MTAIPLLPIGAYRPIRTLKSGVNGSPERTKPPPPKRKVAGSIPAWGTLLPDRMTAIVTAIRSGSTVPHVPTAALAALVLAASLLVPSSARADTGPPPDPSDERVHTSYMAFGDTISTQRPTPGGTIIDPYYSWERLRGYGVAGTTARQMNRWWPEYLEALDHRPKVAVILVGANDLAAGVRARAVITRLKRLVRTGAKHGVEVVFGTLTPAADGSSWRAVEKRRLVVNTWITRRDQFVDYADATTCDPGRYLCDYYADPYTRDNHPNDLGQQAMGEVLTAWIDQDSRSAWSGSRR